MKKNILLFLCFMIFGQCLYAQTDSTIQAPKIWNTGVNLGMNFSQVQLSNWAGGGQSSISVTGLAGFFSNMKREKTSWNNSLDITYGQAKLGEREFRKTDDQIIIKSLYNRFFNKRWVVAAGFDFRTQFDKGYKYEEVTDPVLGKIEKSTFISAFMAPGYLNTNLGIGYNVPHFKAMLSPLSSKFTFVLDEELAAQGAYGVDSSKNVRKEWAGLSMNIIVDFDLMENVKYKTNFLAFTDYTDSFREIDINWENQLLFKVNKYINTTITTQLIYDEDVDINREDGTVGPATQFKGVLNIGLVYSLGTKKQ